MYKVFTSLWSKPATSASSHYKTRLSSVHSSDSPIDEDSWVIVTDTVLVSKIPPATFSNDNHNSIMSNSWIASPPLMNTDQSLSMNRPSSPATHQFNPIENLLIEHASMSVYEQIASRTRARRHRKMLNDDKLDEQVESVGPDDDDDDDRASVVLQNTSQHPNLSSVHHRHLTGSLCHSTSSSISALESSTSSLVAHHRHLQRIHQRRRRSTKTTSSKLALATSIDESKSTSNKVIDRQRLNHARAPKLVLHQPPRSNH